MTLAGMQFGSVVIAAPLLLDIGKTRLISLSPQ